MPVCDDLRLGGTLSASGIAGGLSINDTAIQITDWSGVFGHAGFSASPLEVSGRPGAFLAGDMLGRPRFPTLHMAFSRFNSAGGLTAPTPEEQLWENTDDFLTLLADPDGQYLEYDLPSGITRFLKVFAIDASQIDQPRFRRTMSVPLVGDWPYWRDGGAQDSQVINGVDVLNNVGRVSVYDPVLVFAGDGTFTHNTEGWAIEVIGSAAAVTVNLGTRTVIESGANADNRIRRTDRDWGWFTAGNNSVQSDVSVTVTWRPQHS